MQDWTYETHFSLDGFHILNGVTLKLEKIGTFANIKLNGQLIQVTDNLFRTYYIRLDPNLLQKNNVLQIEIESTVRKTYELKAYFNGLPGKDALFNNLLIADSYVSFARGQQTDFGWDWSGAFAP